MSTAVEYPYDNKYMSRRYGITITYLLHLRRGVKHRFTRELSSGRDSEYNYDRPPVLKKGTHWDYVNMKVKYAKEAVAILDKKIGTAASKRKLQPD